MTESEIAVYIGELVSTEIDEVNRVYYHDKSLNAFTVLMESGKRFIVEVKELGENLSRHRHSERSEAERGIS